MSQGPRQHEKQDEKKKNPKKLNSTNQTALTPKLRTSLLLNDELTGY